MTSAWRLLVPCDVGHSSFLIPKVQFFTRFTRKVIRFYIYLFIKYFGTTESNNLFWTEGPVRQYVQSRRLSAGKHVLGRPSINMDEGMRYRAEFTYCRAETIDAELQLVIHFLCGDSFKTDGSSREVFCSVGRAISWPKILLPS